MDDDSRIKKIGGGSLLIAWQLKDKNVLIVGGGEVASQRIESILTADANITLLSPEKGLHPLTRRLIALRQDRIIYHDRPFQGPEELDNMDMVLTAIDDNELSHRIVMISRERRIPVNAADIPNLCDFYFGAQIRDGPLQIMISTNGNGPRMAALIKARLQKGLSGVEGEAIVKVGQLRNKLKERAPGVGGTLGRERMKWMTKLCNQWEMEDFTSLDNALMDNLLDEGWEKNRRVPTVQEVGGRPKQRKAIELQFLPLATAFFVGAITTGLLLVCRQRR
ncbi:siroheme synthase [Phlegmacium glaucopus]|nr:siroheme synthase [Phlegmacium glaucopus]